MMLDRPRHARKDVRQFADWLEDEGWTFAGCDGKGHTRWRWPQTGAVVKLPETPHGQRWVAQARVEALRAMGRKRPDGRKARPYQPPKPHPGMVITRRHDAHYAAIVAETLDEIAAQLQRSGRAQEARTMVRAKHILAERLTGKPAVSAA